MAQDDGRSVQAVRPGGVVREITHRGPVFAVEKVEFRDRDGRRTRRDVVRHPGAVTIVPLLVDGRLIMIRNYRTSVEAELLEFPAGKLDCGEAPLEAAARELEEETGYRPGFLAPLGQFYTSPGLTDELMHTFAAANLEEVGQRLQPGEEISIERLSVQQVEAMIAGGAIKDGKTIAAFYLWRELCGSLVDGGAGSQSAAEENRLRVRSTDQVRSTESKRVRV